MILQFRLLLILSGYVTFSGLGAPNHATVAIVVRDEMGQPLRAVELALIQDTTNSGLVEHATGRTDAQGWAVFTDVAWGSYVVQFRGTLPNGQSLLPPAQQNVGTPEDGSPLVGGFGLRVAAADVRALFVISTAPGTTAAVPLWDQTIAPDQPPQPLRPVVQPFVPSVPPASAAPPHTDRGPTVWLVWSLLLGGLLATAILGWVRTQDGPRPEDTQ